MAWLMNYHREQCLPHQPIVRASALSTARVRKYSHPVGSSQALQGCSLSEQWSAPGVDFLAASSRRDGCRSLTAREPQAADELMQECLRVDTLPSPDAAGQNHGLPALVGVMLSARQEQKRGPTPLLSGLQWGWTK